MVHGHEVVAPRCRGRGLKSGHRRLPVPRIDDGPVSQIGRIHPDVHRSGGRRQVSNSQFSSMVPAASEVKIKSQGTAVVLLPTVCVQVLEILPPLAVVAKSAKVPEIKAGKLVCALGTWPAATVKVA